MLALTYSQNCYRTVIMIILLTYGYDYEVTASQDKFAVIFQLRFASFINFSFSFLSLALPTPFPSSPFPSSNNPRTQLFSSPPTPVFLIPIFVLLLSHTYIAQKPLLNRMLNSCLINNNEQWPIRITIPYYSAIDYRVNKGKLLINFYSSVDCFTVRTIIHYKIVYKHS